MKLSIYKASAGSGKTHILAGKFITEAFGMQAPSRTGSPIFEAFGDTMAFSRILAVTFTNKAAGEMKERIIRELDKLASGQKSDYIADIIKRYPKYSEQQVRERARSIRSAILHNYSDFCLRTIDSFVQRVVRAFCYDISISAGFSTQTDQAVVLDDLMEILMKKSDSDPELRKTLLSLAEKNVTDGKTWDFRKQLKSLAKLIFTEDFAKMENLYKGMDTQDRRAFYQDKLRSINDAYNRFLDEAREISQQAQKIFRGLTITPSDIGRNMGALANFLTNGIYECELKPAVLKMNEGTGWMNATPTPNQKKYVPELRPKLEPLLSKAISLIEESATDFLTAKVLRKNFYAFMLLGDIAALMPDYRTENRMMLVSDATALLNSLVANNDAPFIYERVGNRYDHIYIDEFQDTSEFQWNNFRPLIENSLAQGCESMIVGDVKQAIYRFRGGDWSLLSEKVQQQIGSPFISENTLDTNWRSRRNIVRFNNAIFRKSVPMMSLMCGDGLDFSQLGKIYSDSYQKMPPNGGHSGGKVNVIFFSKQDQEADEPGDDPDPESGSIDNAPGLSSIERQSLGAMASEIDRLLKSGVRPKKICILVRTGAQANKCVSYLMQYQQADGAESYDIISSDSLYICSSLTVSLISSAMKFINNPSDLMAKAEMMRAHCVLSGIEISDDEIIKAAAGSGLDQDILPSGLSSIMESFSDLPLYDLCEKLISCFQLYRYEGDSEYIRAFEDCVLTFSKNYSSDLNKFVNWWDESGCKSAIQPSDNQDAVTVMTVHRSKGLDFSIQFIPFCSWKLNGPESNNDNYIWVQMPEGTPFSDFPAVPVNSSSILSKTYFASQYQQERQNMAADSLNLLYVALTRAVDELYIYCPKPKEGKDEKIASVADLLYYCITRDIQPNDNDECQLASYFSSSGCSLLMDEGHSLEPGFKEKDFGQFRLKPFRNAPWEDKLSILSHSSDFFIQNSPFLQDRINHGLLMHDVMQHIEYIGDAPEALSDMVYQGRITEAQRCELAKMLDEAFRIPIVRKWFSPGWKRVNSERALLTKDGDIRIPDRVLEGDAETVVIDFKFGKERPEYHAQIAEYAQLLSQMRYPGIKAYLYYVEDGKIVEVAWQARGAGREAAMLPR